MYTILLYISYYTIYHGHSYGRGQGRPNRGLFYFYTVEKILIINMLSSNKK